MVIDSNDSVDTGVVIYICSASEYASLNKKNNDTNIIGYLDSYFEYFDFHDTPVNVDPFEEFLDACGFTFSSVHVPFEYTTIAMKPIDIHVPSRSTIVCFEHYP